MLTTPPTQNPCPTCHAEPDQPCVRVVSQVPMAHCHWARSTPPRQTPPDQQAT